MDCLLNHCYYCYKYRYHYDDAASEHPCDRPARRLHAQRPPPRTNPSATEVTACFSPWQFSLLISSLDVSLNFLLIGG